MKKISSIQVMVTIQNEDYSSYYSSIDLPASNSLETGHLLDAARASIPLLLISAAEKRQLALDAAQKKDVAVPAGKDEEPF